MDVHFSSKSAEWDTPRQLFDDLDKIFQFTLDPCCTADSAKCVFFHTKENDGLSQSWQGHRVFMNPPYGREIGRWVQKAYYEAMQGGCTAVCLLPARTDTKWWARYCDSGTVIFLTGRAKFENRTLAAKTTSAPFPSALVIFGRFFNKELRSAS